MRNLPLGGQAPSSGMSVRLVALREVRVSGRSDRILSARLVLRNRAGRRLPFGPQHVYLADAAGTLLLRISEQWLPEFYDAKLRGIPATAEGEAIASFPSAEVRLANVRYTAPTLTDARRDEVAAQMASFVDAAFVQPQKAAPGIFFNKGSEVTLGTLVKDGTLRPGERISGYVYFYHPASRPRTYPLRLVVVLQDEVDTFLFRER